MSSASRICWAEDTAKPGKKKARGVQFPHQKNSRLMPTHDKVEARIAQLEIWIAQRQPKRFISVADEQERQGDFY